MVLLIAFGALTLASPDFLTGNNLANLARQVSIFGIIAIGQLMVILTGGIDLSVGSILGLSGAVTAQLLVAGIPIIPAVLIGLIVGGVLGLINGLLVTRFKLPPFIATLGMLGIARGVVLVITDANTIQGLPEGFQTLANGSVLGIPNLPIMFVAITAIASFVLRRTVFGRYIYAVGSNPEAARLAGVPVAVVTTAVYAVAGLLAAVGGVPLTSRLGAGVPTAGTGFELQAIAACVIGGASLSGARGSAIGAACGALLIGVLNNGGNLLAVNSSGLGDHRPRSSFCAATVRRTRPLRPSLDDAGRGARHPQQRSPHLAGWAHRAHPRHRDQDHLPPPGRRDDPVLREPARPVH